MVKNFLDMPQAGALLKKVQYKEGAQLLFSGPACPGIYFNSRRRHEKRPC
jgi:hypothetical protein